jgi:hypothetical protein
MNSFQRPPIAASAAVKAQPGTALSRARRGELPAGAFLELKTVLATVVSMSSISTRSTRRAAVAALGLMCAAAHADTSPAAAGTKHDTAPAVPASPPGAPHDFDFEHGRWRTSLRRLVRPLSGSQEWAEYTGSTVVHALLGGRANLVELDVSGPQGRIEGVSLRLFDTQQRRWTLNFSNAAAGTLELPMTGGFGGGKQGIFYSAETLRGRPILARFVIDVVDADTCRFEQAFSADAGATWEVNWIAVDTRLR